MATRLTLLCCAATAIQRAGGFATADEPAAGVVVPPSPPGRADAGARSPAAAAAATAAAIGLDAAVDARLRDMDFGDWAGRRLADLPGDAVARWLAAPHAGAPGGETLAGVRRRVRPWLAEVAAAGGRTVAITHAMTVRALLCEALGMTAAAAMRIDLPPLGTATLSFTGVWRLQQLGRDRRAALAIRAAAP